MPPSYWLAPTRGRCHPWHDRPTFPPPASAPSRPPPSGLASLVHPEADLCAAPSPQETARRAHVDQRPPSATPSNATPDLSGQLQPRHLGGPPCRSRPGILLTRINKGTTRASPTCGLRRPLAIRVARRPACEGQMVAEMMATPSSSGLHSTANGKPKKYTRYTLYGSANKHRTESSSWRRFSGLRLRNRVMPGAHRLSHPGARWCILWRTRLQWRSLRGAHRCRSLDGLPK